MVGTEKSEINFHKLVASTRMAMTWLNEMCTAVSNARTPLMATMSQALRTPIFPGTVGAHGLAVAVVLRDGTVEAHLGADSEAEGAPMLPHLEGI